MAGKTLRMYSVVRKLSQTRASKYTLNELNVPGAMKCNYGKFF